MLKLFSIISLLLLIAVSAKASGDSTAVPDALSAITAQQLRIMIAENKPIVILDVRQPDEYNAGHILGSILIPLDTLEERSQELAKDKEIVAYCRSGKRSAQAVTILRALGYSNAVSLQGGFQAWQRSRPMP